MKAQNGVREMHVPYVVFMDELPGLWLVCQVGLPEAVFPFGHWGPVLSFTS